MVLRLALAQKIGLAHARPCCGRDRSAAGRRRAATPGSWRARYPAQARSARYPMHRHCPARSSIAGAAWGEERCKAARRQIANVHRSISPSPRCGGTGLCGGARRDLAGAKSRPAGEAARRPSLPGFGEGRWWVQDLAASLPARLIPAGAEEVLDLCAAPGGKTMQLAAAGHRVTAVDASKSRLATTAREPVSHASRGRAVDGGSADLEAAPEFDAILLDAPCSATGTFRRHPEVLYRARRTSSPRAPNFNRGCSPAPRIGSSPAARSSIRSARWSRRKARTSSPPSSKPTRISRSMRRSRANSPTS